MKLYDWQARAIDRLRTKVLEGKRRNVLVSPTGSGKTVMIADVIRSAVKKGGRAMVVAHRKELIDQTYKKLRAFGIQAGVIMADDPRRDDYLPAQVCSAQTLKAWRRKKRKGPPASVIVLDECHHYTSNTGRELLEEYPEAIVLGATATPWPPGRVSLSEIFDDFVVAATMKWLIENGYLCRYEAFAYDAPDLHEVRRTAGDYNQKDLGIACNTEVLVGNAVHEYVKHARGRRGLCFPVDIEHSRALVGQFVGVGVRAEHLDCNTPKRGRERVLAALESGAVDIVSSVGVLTEGFDCPAAEVAILCRPTESLTLYMQMVGRVMRAHPGKERALIHDHAGNILRLGLPDDERDYSLVPTPARVRALHTCPLCSSVFGSILRDGRCPKCGQIIAPPAEVCDLCGGSKAKDAPKETACSCRIEEPKRKSKRLVEGVRLSAEEIVAIRERRKEKGIERELTDHEVQLVSRATKEEMIAEYRRLLLVTEQRGFKIGFAMHKFRELFGKWPRFEEKELDTVEPAKKPFLPLPARKSDTDLLESQNGENEPIF